MRAKKALGQHFLHDERALSQIAALAMAPTLQGLYPDLVYEVGPGTGNLTDALLRHPRATRVIGIERDDEMLVHLQRRFKDRALEIVLGRAETANFEAIGGDAACRVVAGNLPYYAAAPIYFHILSAHRIIRRAVLMFQLEVAERIAAGPGSRIYGSPSVMTALWGRAEIALKIPPEAFRPAPKIDSAVVVVDISARPQLDIADDVAGFERFVRTSFGLRRKTLVNALLRTGLDRRQLEAALIEVGLNTQVRAEHVSPTAFAALFRSLRKPLRASAPVAD